MSEQLEIVETREALAARQPTEQDIVTIGKQLESHPQVPCPLEHVFLDGVYERTIHMPAGTWVIGHRHKTEHDNEILEGVVSVWVQGKVQHIVAPASFRSGVGARKVLYIHRDCVWRTRHENPTNERDIRTLETAISDKFDPSEEQAVLADFRQCQLEFENFKGTF